MNKVYNISHRLEGKKQKQQVEAFRNRSETVQRIVQCASCHYRCTMCGCYLRGADLSCPPASSDLDFILCEICRAEFEDFAREVSGKEGSGIFWHNKEWIKVWSAWLNYQQTIKDFRNSSEFKQMTKKLDD